MVMMMMMIMIMIMIPTNEKFGDGVNSRIKERFMLCDGSCHRRTAGDMPAMSTPMCADGYVGDGCVSCNQAKGWLRVCLR